MPGPVRPRYSLATWARFCSTSPTKVVLLSSARTSGERQSALARLDAASYRCKRFRSRWQLPSRTASGYLCRRRHCLSIPYFPSLSTETLPVSSCLRFSLLGVLSLKSCLIPCLSLNVTRLVGSCAASNTLALVPVLECESCSADGSEVVAYCRPPLPRHTLG